MKKLVIGILAHVDSGKTTLSEAMLYVAGKIRKLGRVDHQDAYLDTDSQERDRGITIFSKQAEFSFNNMEITLLDTPGHVDFGAEMERTLQVLDYAVLVVSGTEGVQSHTETLWRLLKRYNVPAFIFVNKMDASALSRKELMADIRSRLSDSCVDFYDDEKDEQIAMSDEDMMENYLLTGLNRFEDVVDAVADRKLFPCFFGSALKNEGVSDFLENFERYTKEPVYGENMSARVFKILRDAKGERLTYLKVTGGSLKNKDNIVTMLEDGTEVSEKINQIRVYSGNKYECIEEAFAGQVCAVCGLVNTYIGQGIGDEGEGEMPSLEPVLNYKVLYPDDIDAFTLMTHLKLLQEEDPQLHVEWREQTKEIYIKVMGQVQIEVIQRIVKERFGVSISFGTGRIAYKETVKAPVMGVGHFEPLRHYAEVHLMIEPLEAGSGIVCDTICSEDCLDKNWQRLIYTHVMERQHRGVLTGSPLTDVKITITAGRAHQKHTEGGDFRQSTYRAIRQGLMSGESILLEPYYSFRMEVPQENVGRAMADITKNFGTFEGPEVVGEMAVLSGEAPVSTMQEYHKELISYTRGVGRITLTLSGYKPCHNQDEMVEKIGYNPDNDFANPAASVFCAFGSGFMVEWYDVYDYMHIKEDPGFALIGRTDYGTEEFDETPINAVEVKRQAARAAGSFTYTEEELEEIFVRTYGSQDKSSSDRTRGGFNRFSKNKSEGTKSYADRQTDYIKDNKPANIGLGGRKKKNPNAKNYLLVDGYNIIFAWDDLKELASVNIGAARDALIDILCNYQGYKGCELILIFDAYKVKDGLGSKSKHNNIHVVFTKEAETADQYIEKTTHELGRNHNVTVATSDGLEQLIIMGQGAVRWSARNLREEIERVNGILREEFLK